MTRKLAEMGCVSSKPAEEDASRGKDIHGKDFGKHGVQVSPKPLAKEQEWHVSSCIHRWLSSRIEGNLLMNPQY